MYVPVIKKVSNCNDALVERALPVEGKINVKVGDTVEPFTQLGSCSVPFNKIVLPRDFTPFVNDTTNKISEGTAYGKYKRKILEAPFNGYLSKEKDGWVFKETGHSFALLSGVWGVVQDITENNSVLIKTQYKEILVPIIAGNNYEGELIVFPNPSDLLVGSFMENYIKDVSAKIFYIGSHINLKVAKKAHELGINALMAGSISREAFVFIKEKNINLGVFEGFGGILTSKVIFDELKEVSNRFVFFEADRNLLRIPMSECLETINIKKPLKLLKAGDIVQILQNPYFGEVGEVDSISVSSIFVKIPKSGSSVEVKVPNFFALA